MTKSLPTNPFLEMKLAMERRADFKNAWECEIETSEKRFQETPCELENSHEIHIRYFE